MDLRIFTEPQQGATFDQLARVAVHAEEAGFDAFFRSDHYLRIGPGDPGPGSTDAWITLAGIARETSRLRLGTLLSSATFRLPGPLAISVAEVDQMSGGRAELGLGAGWYEAEHTAYGIPFPPTGERLGRLAEQLEIVTGLWSTPDGERFDFEGRYYALEASPALPKPVQRPRPPVIVGGGGPRRTPALAARFADEFNAPPFSDLDTCVRLYAQVDRACEEAGRDPASLRRSVALTLACGSNDDEVARRVAPSGFRPADLAAHGLVGTPGEVLERLHAYAEVGASRVYLQLTDLDDLDHLSLVADEVLSRLS